MMVNKMAPIIKISVHVKQLIFDGVQLPLRIHLAPGSLSCCHWAPGWSPHFAGCWKYHYNNDKNFQILPGRPSVCLRLQQIQKVYLLKITIKRRTDNILISSLLKRLMVDCLLNSRFNLSAGKLNSFFFGTIILFSSAMRIAASPEAFIIFSLSCCSFISLALFNHKNWKR